MHQKQIFVFYSTKSKQNRFESWCSFSLEKKNILLTMNQGNEKGSELKRFDKITVIFTVKAFASYQYL